MFYEYALDPAALTSWDRTRFFLDAFGPWKGRFLAKYPKAWKRMVYEGLNCPDMEKARIIERLKNLDERAFGPRKDAPYDPARDWLTNAELEHARQPFHAIISARSAADPHVIDAADADDRHERWRVQSGQMVSRDPASLVRSLVLLLRASRRLVLVDPYFRADQRRKVEPIVALCLAIADSTSVEIHFTDPGVDHSVLMAAAAHALPRALPFGRQVTLRCWRQRFGGRRLHNRYLLSDVGGVQFGDGIETGSGGADQDHLSILDEPSWAGLWSDYVGATPAFDIAGPPQVFTGSSSPRRR